MSKNDYLGKIYELPDMDDYDHCIITEPTENQHIYYAQLYRDNRLEAVSKIDVSMLGDYIGFDPRYTSEYKALELDNFRLEHCLQGIERTRQYLVNDYVIDQISDEVIGNLDATKTLLMRKVDTNNSRLRAMITNQWGPEHDK